MEEPRPEDNMTVEEAQQIIQEEHDNPTVLMTDDVYPWWSKLKAPLLLMSAVVAGLCLALLLLSFTVKSLANERNKQDAKDDCYSLFSNASAEAVGQVRAAAGAVDNAGWTALAIFAREGTLADLDIEHLNLLISRSEDALDLDKRRLAEREDWIVAGSPLPCPIGPPSRED